MVKRHGGDHGRDMAVTTVKDMAVTMVKRQGGDHGEETWR